ncbi:MAG TPA: hypothetical protein VGR74_10275 [Actinomycetota bacterium]|nr:hypothetical protein [Actinomycetota bacterium]
MSPPARRGARLAPVLLLVVLAVGWLGLRAVGAFDQQRHLAQAAAVVATPDAVVHRIPPVPGRPQVADAGGELAYRPGEWLTVIRLHGLTPVAGHERYLVFMRNYWGWVLAGAVHPDAAGDAELRSASEPRPPTIYEVVVTRGIDDATSVPHGEPVLHWYEPAIAPRKAAPFDFVRGA